MTNDPRLTPARHDLAAAHLQGQVEAARFVTGRPMHLRAEIADLRHAPSPDVSIDTQILHGEDLMLYDEHEGWAWVQLETDKYVGYVSRDALAEGPARPTHRVDVNRTFIYPAPNMKTPPLGALPLGAAVHVQQEDEGFARLADGGFVFAAHLASSTRKAADFVAVAEGFSGCPYLWGGKSSLGIDCSGLVQVALRQAGVSAPRDTDMQEGALGQPLNIAAVGSLRRGDLVFWKGHVGIMRDAQTLLHANGHHMLVSAEPLAKARARIGEKGAGEITAIRRV
jgi:cell wall-associated NlpC family hydrolase